MEFFYSNQVYKKHIQLNSMHDRFGSWILSKFNRLQKNKSEYVIVKRMLPEYTYRQPKEETWNKPLLTISG